MKQLTKDKAEKLKPGAVVFLKASPQKKANMIELGPDVEHIYVPCKVTGLTPKKWVRTVVDLRDHAYYDLNLDKLGVFGVEQIFAPVLLKQPSETLPVYYYLRSSAVSTAVPMLPDTAEEAEAATKQWEAFLAAKDAILQKREDEIETWTSEQNQKRIARYQEAREANEKHLHIQMDSLDPKTFMTWYLNVNKSVIVVHTVLKNTSKGWKVTHLAYFLNEYKGIKVAEEHPPSKTWQEAISEALYQLAYRLWEMEG